VTVEADTVIAVMSVVAPVVTVGVTVWAVRRGFRNDARLQRRAVALAISNDGRRELVGKMDAYCAWFEKAADLVSSAPRDREIIVGLQPFGVSTALLRTVFGDLDDQLLGLRRLPALARDMAPAFPSLADHQSDLEEADRDAASAWRNFKAVFKKMKEGRAQAEELEMAGREAREYFAQALKKIGHVRDEFQSSTLQAMLSEAIGPEKS